MIVFIKRILLFTVTWLILLIGVESVLSKRVYSKINLEIDKNSKYYVLGHSHSACSINDSIATNLINLSDSRESYFYTYYKLKYILNQNIKPEHVFIEFSNNNISEQMDDWLFSGTILSKYLSYFSLVDYEGKYFLLKNVPKSFINSSFLSFRKSIPKIFDKKISFDAVRGYVRLDYSITDSLIRNKAYLKSNENYNFKNLSETNIKYLEKIIYLCSENNIKISLMRSPLNKHYLGLQNEALFLTELKRISNENKVGFYDFSTFQIDKDEFVDFQHLNYKGATKFTNHFSDYILKLDAKSFNTAND